MPTKDDWEELRDNTNYEWVEDYLEISGLNGGIFSSTLDSSKFIFIPANGTVVGTAYKDDEEPREKGTIWTTATRNGKADGGASWFVGAGPTGWTQGGNKRYQGRGIRAVQHVS